MVRWRLCLALAVMLLLPTRISSKSEDDDDEDNNENGGNFKIRSFIRQPISRRGEDADDEDDDDDDDNEEDETEKRQVAGDMVTGSGRRASVVIATPKTIGPAITRTVKKRPLECYVCAYKSENPIRACLDPTKFRVHTITCHSVDEKCFTSVVSKGETYEAVVRGCRSSCVGTPETTCCDLNRCNNQAFAMPLIQPRAGHTADVSTSKTNKCVPPLFFITVLLVLQTVVKVTMV